MSFIDLIKELSLSLSLTKRTGDSSTQSKIKTKNNTGDVAGRDMHKTYVTNAPGMPTPIQELPYVYFQGSFGGNGVQLKLGGCSTHNLSDQFVFLEHIEVLGRKMQFNDHVIKAGEAMRHSGIDDLVYPDTDEERFLELFFKAKNGKQFVARQKLQYDGRQDGKFNIVGLSKSQIVEVDA